MKKYLTRSSSETKGIARRLAEQIMKKGPRAGGAAIIALVGDLGAGKTTFAQGFLRGLGVRKKITSPTFVLLKNYQIRKAYKAEGEAPRLYRHGLLTDGAPQSGTPHRKPFIHGFAPMAFWCVGKNFSRAYHADFYRLHSAAQLRPLKFNDILRDSRNIVLIEWPERAGGGVLNGAVRISFKHGETERERVITIKSVRG